jgi:hypothetical protein
MFFDVFDPEEKINSQEDKLDVKIAKKIIGCNFEKNICGTIPYDVKVQKNNLIKDFKNQYINKRIFYKNDKKEIGYIEVFQVPLLKFAHQINKNISFLFIPHEINDANLDVNKCFGFRYYDSENHYCTLLKKDDDDKDNYFFLEKFKTDKTDIFYNEKLDCFQIIYEAIFSKYKNFYKPTDEDFDYQMTTESPLYEIIGFNYASQLRSTDTIKFHKIHLLNPVNDGDFTSVIERNTDKKILNIMPILFDGHISILFFVDINSQRYYILSDPSHVHSSTNIKNNFLFTQKMIKSLNVIPEQKIQIFSSSGLWYFLQILNFVNYNEEIQSRKYKNAEDFYFSVKNSELYFDCFNYYNFIMGFKSKLIEISPKINFDNPNYFYFSHEDPFRLKYFPDKVKIHKFCFLNQLVDIFSLIELKTKYDLSILPVMRELNDFKEQNEEFIELILHLNNNINYLDLSNQKKDQVPILFKYVDKINAFRTNYIINVKDYVNMLVTLNLKEKGLKIDSVSKNKTLIKLRDKIQGIYEDFKKSKEFIESNIILYPLTITGEILFPIIGCLYHS